MEFKKVAKVYDEVIGSMDYEAWTHDILFLTKTHLNDEKKKILDVGCGTGGHLQFLEKYHECVGVDASKEMIAEAKKKLKSPVYVQDMRELNLKEKFDVILCLYDSINNLENLDEIKKAFISAHKHLKKDGLYIFDTLTLKSISEMNEYAIQAGHNKDNSYIWENAFKDDVWEWTFTLFCPKKDGSYEKHVEHHKEYYFDIDDLNKLLEETGFEFLEATDAYTMQHVDETTDRINIVARKK